MRIKLQTYIVDLRDDGEYAKKYGSIEFEIPDDRASAFFNDLDSAHDELIKVYKND